MRYYIPSQTEKFHKDSGIEWSTSTRFNASRNRLLSPRDPVRNNEITVYDNDEGGHSANPDQELRIQTRSPSTANENDTENNTLKLVPMSRATQIDRGNS